MSLFTTSFDFQLLQDYATNYFCSNLGVLDVASPIALPAPCQLLVQVPRLLPLASASQTVASIGTVEQHSLGLGE